MLTILHIIIPINLIDHADMIIDHLNQQKNNPELQHQMKNNLELQHQVMNNLELQYQVMKRY